MARSRSSVLGLSALLGACAFAGAALAAGGGMSGEGGAPSFSAPSFDPAIEYRKDVDAYQAGKFRKAEKAFDHILTAAPKNSNI